MNTLQSGTLWPVLTHATYEVC